MIRNYVLMTVRAIRRNPGSSIINLLGLAIGMVGFAVIMLFVVQHLSYDRFHQNADRIVRINKIETYDGLDPEHSAITSGMVAPALERDLPEVEVAIRVMPWFDSMPLVVGENVLKSQDVLFADDRFFDVFSFELITGDRATALVEPQSIVVTERLARRLFGDENPLGEVLTGLHDHLYTVTGVIEDPPADSHLRYEALISWSSTVPGVGALQFNWANRWLTNSMYTFALLADGTDIAAFDAKLPGFLEQNYPDGASRHRYYSQPLTSIHLHSAEVRHQRSTDLSQASFVFTFALCALLILLIAGINFVNLSTALANERTREVGVRKALGASRAQLRRQFLGESVVLATVAFAIAVFVIELIVPLVNQILDARIRGGLLTNVPALASALPTVVLIGLLAGLYPAAVLSRFRTSSVLRGAPHGVGGGTNLRRLLVGTQFAVTTVLVGGSLVVVQQTEFMTSSDLGIDDEQVILLNINNTELTGHFEAFRDEVERHPGVLSTSGSNWAPGESEQTYGLNIEGRPDDEDWIIQVIKLADFDFGETYGIEMASGRFFDGRFPTDTASAVVINEALARSIGWTNEGAIGKRLEVAGEQEEAYVVGVMRDFHVRSLQHSIEPLVLINQRRVGNFAIRVAPEMLDPVLTHVETAWGTFEARHPFEYTFADETFASMYSSERQFGRVLGAFSFLAVLVACLGLFGLTALLVRRRTKEIGIRKALGASFVNILALLTGDIARLLAIATVVGVPIAYVLADRWLEGFANRIALTVEPFALVALGMVVVGMAVVAAHSLRAAVSDPVNSLRHE